MKYDTISHFLFAPVGAAPDAGTSVPGATPAPASPADNFYSADTEGAPEGAAAPAGDTPAAGGEDFTSPEGEAPAGEDFVKIGEAGDDAAAPAEGEQAAPQAPQAPAQTLKLDPETIAALRAGLQPPTAPAAPQSQLTPQQLKQMLNPVEVTPELLGTLGFTEATPEQVAGFQNFTNAIVKNAVSIARVMIDQKAKQFEETISPIAQQHQQAQVDQTRQSFYAAHKDLAPYEKIVKLAAMEVSPTRVDGSEKSQKEIFDEVAAQTRATLKSYNIHVTPANPGAPGRKVVPQPNKLSPSGRSGGDTNGQRGKPNNADADIYQR